VKRIVRKVKSLYLEAGVKNFRTLSAIHPFDKLNHKIITENKKVLQPYYDHYVKEVSVPNMAASLELAATLLSICQVSGYKKLADLGSGFSSFVLRYYATTNNDVVVYSIDDHREWLEKTRSYLVTSGVSDEHLMTLDDFIGGNFSGFDCIIHDLNFVEVRINYIMTLLPKLSPTGILILDDMHKPDYRHEVLRKLKTEPFDVYDLSDITKDSFGRYTMVALRA
jgi:predicted O-methyltransferase YrrM